jgi:small subunit ribosomal protein S15
LGRKPEGISLTANRLAKIVNTCYRTLMLSKRKKANSIKESQRHDTDTGSPEVQVGILTRQIEELTDHLKKHPNDVHSRRGLLSMVANRKTHLKYLEKNDKRRFNSVVKKLNLKK